LSERGSSFTVPQALTLIEAWLLRQQN
jgi:hypothetical protein